MTDDRSPGRSISVGDRERQFADDAMTELPDERDTAATDSITRRACGRNAWPAGVSSFVEDLPVEKVV